LLPRDQVARDTNKGLAREAINLVLHVVRNDRSYKEILTADYVMLTPYTAKSYNVKAKFKNENDPYETVEGKRRRHSDEASREAPAARRIDTALVGTPTPTPRSPSSRPAPCASTSPAPRSPSSRALDHRRRRRPGRHRPPRRPLRPRPRHPRRRRPDRHDLLQWQSSGAPKAADFVETGELERATLRHTQPRVPVPEGSPPRDARITVLWASIPA
jgi:hypothetical protein